MSIRSKDKNIDFYVGLYEWENPGKIRAKRSSNSVFLGCALVFSVFLIVYAMRLSDNMTLEQEIADNIAYTTDEANIEKELEQIKLMEQIEEIEDYNWASETFLGQLQNSERFSTHLMNFFDTEMVNAIGNSGSILTFTYTANKITLDCIATSQDLPRTFARHLTNLEDEEGNPRFADIYYPGFKEEEDGYEFSIVVTLWEPAEPPVEEIAAPVEDAEAESQ